MWKMSMLELLWSPGYVSSFLPACTDLKFSRSWRRALVVAILKLMKSIGVPKSDRPIFLLLVSDKILDRLIYPLVKPNYRSMLLREQAEFRREKSTVDRVILLRENIEDFFVDFSIWRRHMILYGILALHVSCLRLLPYKHMVGMIMEHVQTQSFTLKYYRWP